MDSKHFLAGIQVGESFDVYIEKGKRLNIKCLGRTNEVNKAGQQKVFISLNGQMRTVYVEDKAALQSSNFHPKASKGDKLQVGAPMPGDIIETRVKPGDSVEKGDTVAIISAMKMEMLVKAEKSGIVKEVQKVFREFDLAKNYGKFYLFFQTFCICEKR